MKIIKRIGLGIVIVVVALVVFLVGSVVLDALLGGGRLDALTNTDISNANGPDIRAYVARPATPGPHPAVIMIHEFWGLRPDIVGKAEALAQEGYIVVAPDLFRGSTTGWVPRAIYQVVSTPQEQIIGDLDAVFAWLESQADVKADRIAVMGFCFGGGASLRYSLTNNGLAGTVLLYGSPITDASQLKSLPGPVLGIFGGADQSISVSQVNAFEAGLNEAGVPNQITIYENQPHAFVKSIEEIQQGGPQGQAWDEVLVFLKETLQDETGSNRRQVSPAQVVGSTDWRYWLMLAYEHTIGSGAHH
ncbi:MAG: dienelactone hydrolase family protein [Chloroflexi bacterium]|nr:dienelactone hydrolase family protein [Chloroflexota bacterium]